MLLLEFSTSSAPGRWCSRERTLGLMYVLGVVGGGGGLVGGGVGGVYLGDDVDVDVDVEDDHHDDHLVVGGGGTVDSAGGGASPDLEPKIPRISCKILTAAICKFENCRQKLQSSPLSMENSSKVI